MMKRHFWFTMIVVFPLIQCTSSKDMDDCAVNMTPAPVKMVKSKGCFELNAGTRIWIQSGDPEQEKLAQYFKDLVQPATGFELDVEKYDGTVPPNRGIVFMIKDPEVYRKEAYQLTVRKNQVVLKAAEPNGLFYAIQSIRQLLPPQVESSQKVADLKWTIPMIDITDYPRFPWRGMHLDVSRHFFPKEFIKRYIDLIAFHKMNIFHWHLVDDQGWRIEIEKYPKLTEVGAWRVDRGDADWSNRKPQQPGEEPTYGGFYTKEDIRDIVAYASDRYVTIVPEIEMPAHTASSLAAYPEYSCTGGPFTVPPGGVWPITNIYCAGKESTFEFLEDILSEVMDLFPGAYVHIGGDEASKDEWEKCPDCQRRMKEEGLANENELQSYFIRRIEKFLVAHDRRLIGWDEILEGGLAPEATVMSWRGMAGGIEAARMDHDVVMTPGSHCYFDHYQADPSTEPKAWGGYTTLKKVYSFEPVPAELNDHEASHILGAQANLWTEYVTVGSQAEYMVLPRMTALSEVVWSPAANRDWENFAKRINTLYDRFELLGWNYSEGSFQVEMGARYDQEKNAVVVTLSSEQPDPVILYTLDGTDPTPESMVYDTPFVLDKTATVKAAVMRGDEIAGNISNKDVNIHLASGKQVGYVRHFSNKYDAGGTFALVDGIQGTRNYSDGHWQGFEGDDMEVVIDLGESRSVSKISVGFLQRNPSWIFFPEWVAFSTSEDGSEFVEWGRVMNDVPDSEAGTLVKNFQIRADKQSARYVKVRARNMGVCPPWHAGAGGKAWIFVDEIVVE